MKSIYVLQLLSTKRVQSFRAVREEETALMVNRIAESSALDSPVNLSEMFVSLTNDVICRAAFGRKYGDGKTGEKFKRVLREFLELLSGFDFGRLSPWLAWVNRVNGLDAKVERVAKEIDEFLEGVVEERLNGFKGERDDGGGEVEDEGREDFLDILLRVSKDNISGIYIDRESIKALILVSISSSLS